MLKDKSELVKIFKNITHKNKYGGVFGFDRKQEMLFISACVASTYIKSEKKINADNYSVATDVAVAA